MIAAGHRVVAFGVERDRPTEAALNALGAEFRTWPLSRAGMNPVRDAVSLAVLTRQFREIRPDVVISYTMKPVVYGSLAAGLAGVPRVYSMMTGLGYAYIGSDSRARIAGEVLDRLLKLSFRNNAAVLVYNDGIEDRLRDRHIFKSSEQCVRIAGTGVDLDSFPEAPLPEGPMTFLVIARLIADKGIREFAEAARRLKSRWPDARFVLVGPYDANPTGLRADEVEAWVRSGILEYAGETRDVRPFLRSCHIYVLPSYAEGVPRSVQEAMATGRPIITTDAPGCRDTVVQDENGLLVPVKDATALSDAMEMFLLNPDRVAPMGRASRKLAERRFDVRTINQQILEITELSGA